MSSKNRDLYTTANGEEIELLAISPFEIQAVSDAVRKKHPLPEVPTYTVETVGGGMEVREHDETTITTDEEKVTWAQYTKEKEAAELAFNLAINDFMLLAGIACEMPSDEKWMALQRKFGVELPDDPEDLRLHYIKTRLLNLNDLNAVIVKLTQKTGVSAEMVETGRASFRSPVRGQGRQTNRQIDLKKIRQVVDSPPFHGAENGEGVGADAVAVG